MSTVRQSDRPWVPLTVAAGLVALLLVALFLAARDEPTELTYSTFTDDHGRACTAATTSTAVVLDCDYPPAENRLGGWLDDLNTTTEP